MNFFVFCFYPIYTTAGKDETDIKLNLLPPPCSRYHMNVLYNLTRNKTFSSTQLFLFTKQSVS